MPYFKYQGKQCYYNESGQGNILLLLHGNTASSKMFDSITDLYKENYKVVVLDFLGHGQSDRIDRFPPDLWFDESMQVITFLEHMQYRQVNIIGSSGGALVALNVALERPDLVNKVIADSFEGETPLADYVQNIKAEREASKHDAAAKMFYEYNHGDDWEQVVDNDTNALYTHYQTIGKFFHKPLERLEMPILLTGSKEDEFAPADFYETTYSALLNKMKNGSMYLFEKGGHPSILSSSNEFFKVADAFLKQN
ncbi:MAG: putative aromatic compounds hydrolase [Firmicutes bacterium]|nr:putative aromatic compounds hydrolase [Bacillota bacterium]